MCSLDPCLVFRHRQVATPTLRGQAAASALVDLADAPGYKRREPRAAIRLEDCRFRLNGAARASAGGVSLPL
jgi:hypothetical protein